MIACAILYPHLPATSGDTVVFMIKAILPSLASLAALTTSQGIIFSYLWCHTSPCFLFQLMI